MTGGEICSVKVSSAALPQKPAEKARCTRLMPSLSSQLQKDAWSATSAGIGPGPDSTPWKGGPEYGQPGSFTKVQSWEIYEIAGKQGFATVEPAACALALGSPLEYPLEEDSAARSTWTLHASSCSSLVIRSLRSLTDMGQLIQGTGTDEDGAPHQEQTQDVSAQGQHGKSTNRPRLHRSPNQE